MKAIKNGLRLALGFIALAFIVMIDRHKKYKQLPETEKKYRDNSVDKVDEASLESFPASDAPAW